MGTIYKEKELRRIITEQMMMELDFHKDFVLTNVAYGNDFRISVTAVSVDNEDITLTVGLKWREGERNAFDYVVELCTSQKYFFTVYKISDDVYTTSKKEFEEAQQKSNKRFNNHFGQNSKLPREVEIKKGSKFYEKYMNIVKETEAKRGRKIKDCDLILLATSYHLFIEYTHRGRKYQISKWIGSCIAEWKLH
jgi:hypothetical protein|nr:MAG TPA: hypothetical protein [Caudoviricetes sp.]